MRCRSVLSRHWLTVGLLLLSLPCFAAQPKDVTDMEMALLPPYCQDVAGFNGYTHSKPSPRAPYWVGLMGKNFLHMHHYCWALINLGRAEKFSTGPMLKRSLRIYTVNNIDYVLNKATPDFVLLPELLVKKATVLLKLGRDTEAVESFKQAAQIKNDYWPAYSGLAEYYRRNGDTQRAKAVAEEGLKYSPESKTLNSMLTELTSVDSRKPRQKPDAGQQQELPPNLDQSQPQDAPQGE